MLKIINFFIYFYKKLIIFSYEISIIKMSSPRITMYKIISNSDPNIVENYINILLKSRWSLYGKMFIENNLYIQEMVKYEESIPTPSSTSTSIPISIPSANELKQKINVVTFSDAEIKMMQTACYDLRMVLQGERSSSKYKDKKCVCISDMPTKLKNHLGTMGYEFSPVESFRNEDYCFMYLA